MLPFVILIGIGIILILLLVSLKSNNVQMPEDYYLYDEEMEKYLEDDNIK